MNFYANIRLCIFNTVLAVTYQVGLLFTSPNFYDSSVCIFFLENKVHSTTDNTETDAVGTPLFTDYIICFSTQPGKLKKNRPTVKNVENK